MFWKCHPLLRGVTGFFSGKTLTITEGYLKEKVLLLFPPNLGKTKILSVLPLAAPLLLTQWFFPPGETPRCFRTQRGCARWHKARYRATLLPVSSHVSALTVPGEWDDYGNTEQMLYSLDYYQLHHHRGRCSRSTSPMCRTLLHSGNKNCVVKSKIANIH